MKPTITSTQNKTIKEYSKLLSKKERKKQNLFLIQGKHLIQEAAKANILKELFIEEHLDNPFDIQATYCSQAVINKLSSQKSNADYIGICHMPMHTKIDNKVLLLDCVQDPGNVGTLIRTAHSFGFTDVYVSADSADLFNPKTVQATQGALFHMHCEVIDIESKMDALQIPVYAAALHHESQKLASIQFPNQLALLLGNEGQGIQEHLIEKSDAIVEIEMQTFESLNVAIAGAILMYTCQNQ